jgi:hypothetical protein
MPFLALLLTAVPNPTLTAQGVTESVLTADALLALQDETLSVSDTRATHFASKPLKPLSGAQRAQLVTAALTVIKAYLATADAHERYGTSKSGSPPDAPSALLTELEAERAKQRAQQAEQLAQTPAAQRGQVQKAFDATNATLERLIADARAPEAKTRYDEQLAEWKRGADAQGRELEPRLKALLTQFLAETKDLPWGAKLGPEKAFVDPAIEEKKPRWWKACWRAGKEPVDAARAFATKWLAELK